MPRIDVEHRASAPIDLEIIDGPDATDTGASRFEEARSARRSTRARWLLAAAAAVCIVGLAGLIARPDPAPTSPATETDIALPEARLPIRTTGPLSPGAYTTPQLATNLVFTTDGEVSVLAVGPGFVTLAHDADPGSTLTIADVAALDEGIPAASLAELLDLAPNAQRTPFTVAGTEASNVRWVNVDGVCADQGCVPLFVADAARPDIGIPSGTVMDITPVELDGNELVLLTRQDLGGHQFSPHGEFADLVGSMRLATNTVTDD